MSQQPDITVILVQVVQNGGAVLAQVEYTGGTQLLELRIIAFHAVCSKAAQERTAWITGAERFAKRGSLVDGNVNGVGRGVDHPELLRDLRKWEHTALDPVLQGIQDGLIVKRAAEPVAFLKIAADRFR